MTHSSLTSQRAARSLAQRSLALCLALSIAIIPMFISGCGTLPEVVQKVEAGLKVGRTYVAAAQDLVPELQQVNPEIAKEVQEYLALAAPNLENLIKLCDAYLAKPSGDKYQNILNGVDALAAGLDARVLAGARVTNTQSQAKAMAILSLAATSAHVVLGILEQKASKAQLKAMPVIAGRATPAEITPFLDRGQAEQQMVAMGLGRAERERAMSAAGM
ncbi:MAG TPA: hypothetical protein VF532_25010 [Candidatus Angelobacter sp.]